MPEAFHFEILTPEKVFYSSAVTSLVAPAFEGYFGVLAHHAPLISRSAGGKLKIRETSEKERFFQVGPGIIEVLKNRVIFLTKRARQSENGSAKPE